MTKRELTGIDLHILLREISKKLENSILKKIKEDFQNKTFLFIFYKKKAGELHLLVELGKRLHLTNYRREFPQPTPFCMLLRKHLKGSVLRRILQKNFERVVEFIFERNNRKYYLVVELFSKGNLLLLNEDRKIVAIFERQLWRDRSLEIGAKYEYPPEKINLFNLNTKSICRLAKSCDKDIVRFLAVDLGLGGLYAEEVCYRAKIDKNMHVNSLTEELANTIIETLKDMLKEEAHLYDDCFAPFELKKLKKSPLKVSKSFNEVLDEYFAKLEDLHRKSIEERKIREKEKKICKISKIIEKLETQEELLREIGNLIYLNLPTIQKLLEDIRKVRRENSWEKVKEMLPRKYNFISEIDEKEGKITLMIENRKISLDLRKNAAENANLYFEKAKKIREEINRLKCKIKEIEKKKGIRKLKKLKRREWYEKFRYFFTSNGFLVIAGKDAATNELLIKKYLESRDIVLHAEIQSPFAIIKSMGRKIDEQSIKEAAVFTACYSKAWKLGLASIDVFWVKPEQVSKRAPSGEYLGKGAFMIYGKRNYIAVSLRLAIGITFENDTYEIIAGPESAVSSKTKYFVVITPGNLKSSDLVKKIKRKLSKKIPIEKREILESIEISEFQKWIPGGGEIRS